MTKKLENKAFEVGEEALLLFPLLTSLWKQDGKGLYRVVRKVSDLDYELDVGRTIKKLCTYCVNLVKRWK